MTAAPTPAHVFKVGFGFWEAKALLSAVEASPAARNDALRPLLHF